MSWLSTLKAQFSPNKAINLEQIERILEQYTLPHSNQAFKARITQFNLEQDVLQIHLFVYENEIPHLEQIHDELNQKLLTTGIRELNLHVVQKKQPQQTTLPPTENAASDLGDDVPISKKAPSQNDIKPHPHIRHVIVVASGKGGVGKSTTTVNLALALKELGLKVGVLDADIYGPSIPTMLGNEGQTPLIENENFVPLNAFDMPVLSIGHLTADGRTPIAWRGSKATGALMQLFNQTLWPNLDVLLIDMPPGTGDIQLTLAQRIPVSGAIIVTTPQHVALMDAQKGIEFFQKVNIKNLGIIENMSTHICTQCGHEEHIFGTDGGEKLADYYQIPVLGHLPLNAEIRKNTDIGKPSVIAKDTSRIHYLEIAEKVKNILSTLPDKQDKSRIF